MNLLDENFPAAEVQELRNRGVRGRHIGRDIGRMGMQDSEILTLLYTLRRPTLFTLDWDFSGSGLCHPSYCLVFLHVHDNVAALFVRRVLRHPALNTQAKRMGAVIQASPSGLRIWRRNEAEQLLAWP